MTPLPLIAITMGDPAGIGPEIIVSAWSNPLLFQSCRPFVIGQAPTLNRAANLMGLPVTALPCPTLSEVSNFPVSANQIPCVPIGEETVVEPRQVSAAGGRIAYRAIELAAQFAIRGQIDALVTAPIHKEAFAAAGINVPGHTELLARFCDVSNVAMMLYLPQGDRVKGEVGLGVSHVTLHMALKEVFENLTKERIVSNVALAGTVMGAMLASKTKRAPKIAVAALNPHAGESGLFGREEIEIIGPAVQKAKELGWEVAGPYPCDTLMGRSVEGEFDAVVAMYHDQGHIALKLMDMYRAVNITLGLPIVRTSVAHGTAFDKAWHGVAIADGLLAAIQVAAQLARNRAFLQWNQESSR